MTDNIFERNPKKTIFLIAISAMVALDFAAGLILTRTDRNTFRRPHPYYHHGLIPNKEAISQWGDGEKYPVFTNSLGFFDEAVREVPLKTSLKRYVFIGDSFTEGIGLPYQKTFVGILSHRVERSRAEILNAAAISYCPKLYHLKIEHLLRHVGLRFDELFVFIDISDIQDEVLYANFEPRPPGEGEQLVHQLRTALQRTSLSYRSIDRLLRHRAREKRRSSYRPDAFPPWLDYFWLDDINLEAAEDPDFAHLRHSWTLPEWYYNRWTQQGIEAATSDMERLVKLCRSHDIRMTIVVYPWITQIEQRDLHSPQVSLWSFFSRRHGVAFIDLFPEFINEMSFDEVYGKYFIPGDTHWNAAGHRLVADAISKHVEASSSR